MRRFSKISIILTAALLVGIAVGLPLLHQHHDTFEEPVECLANIVEKHLNSCQPAQIIAIVYPAYRSSHLALVIEETAFSAFSGFLFINKSPPVLV